MLGFHGIFYQMVVLPWHPKSEKSQKVGVEAPDFDVYVPLLIVVGSGVWVDWRYEINDLLSRS